MYQITHPLKPKKYAQIFVSDLTKLFIGVTDNFGNLKPPCGGLFHSQITDDYGNFVGWKMSQSYAG